MKEFVDRNLKDKWSDRVEFMHSGGMWCDVVCPGNGKEIALEMLGKQCGIDPCEMAAFGDAMNDLKMIAYAGKGYAVETAIDAVKQAADEVIPCYKERGVLNKLYEILAEYEQG